MNCPQCNEPAKRRGGGSTAHIQYYTCANCQVAISVNSGIVKVLEPPLQFRNRQEALHVLYQAVRDDTTWFGGVTEETEEMGRVIFRDYLIKNRTRAAAKRNQQITFGFARRKKAA